MSQNYIIMYGPKTLLKKIKPSPNHIILLIKHLFKHQLNKNLNPVQCHQAPKKPVSILMRMKTGGDH